MIAIGDVVENYSFLRPDGTPVDLASFQGRPLLLLFLRHLA